MTGKTDRLQRDDQIHEIMEQLFDSIPLLVSVFDEQGNPYRLNSVAKRTLAQNTLSPDALLSSDLAGGLDRLSELADTSPVEVESVDFGAMYLVAVRRVQTSMKTFFVHVALDVGATQNKTRIAAHAKRMSALGDFAGRLAHDFSNILSGILGYATLLLEDTRISAGQQKALDVIRQSAERGEALVKQLHSMSTKDRAITERIDLNHVVLDVITVLAETLPKSIRVITELSSDLPKIVGDRLALFQLVLNLTTNAKDAIRERGTIIVRTSVQGTGGPSSVRLDVEDDGRGMPRDVREHMYDPFYSTKTEGKKRGLGLTVVYGIVKSHGGLISCSSDPALGTTFAVTFPMADTRVPPDLRLQESPHEKK